jgi:hypothetical protein
MRVAANVPKAAAAAAVVAKDRKGRAKSRVWMKQLWQTHKTRQPTTLKATPVSVPHVKRASAVTADAVADDAVSAHLQARLKTQCCMKMHRRQRLLTRTAQTRA